MSDITLTGARLLGFSMVGVVLLATGAYAQEAVPFDSERWNVVGGEVMDHLGRQCFNGAAYLRDVQFEDGVIEVDVAVDGSRSYPGLIFRLQSEENYERLYIRPHRAGLYPDAIQYTPVINRVAGWQLYNGEGFTAGAEIPADEWLHLKLEVRGTQARFYLNDMREPALVIHELKHGVSSGPVGVLAPADRTACFSNFRYSLTSELAFDEPPAVETPPGTIIDWEISRTYPTQRANRARYPHFFSIFTAGWRKVRAEPSGLVDISRHVARENSKGDIILARTIFRAAGNEPLQLSFGYSDEVDLFFNGKKVFSANSAYRYRDPSFLGIVGAYDHVYLTTEKGLNEVLMMVSESFGGWGFMMQADRALDLPVREHERAELAWQTPRVFLTPESVQYDRKRDILYVTNFDYQWAQKSEVTGYISKLSLAGEILEQHWVEGLHAPTGLRMYDDKLWVTERRHLTEIDVETGAIVGRYPIPDVDFPNDLAIDSGGNIYISDTRPTSHIDSRIYRFKDGEFEVWMDGDEIVRANGLYVHGERLLVGNTGDGMLKAVSLKDKTVSDIICLGAGVVDGIRVDNSGNYLVSHWEGQTYVITPEGEVVEILNTLYDGVNSADFEYIRERNLLIIPTFMDNRVMAYRLIEP
ncbi:MAG: SMP-30/gluconolactonase/LRE family protein [Gemmatimonadota bacterium]|nr:MAG: SMP-30/gluconolactonase/LRE family protein [Gemmatimonadota bacterium]